CTAARGSPPPTRCSPSKWPASRPPFTRVPGRTGSPTPPARAPPARRDPRASRGRCRVPGARRDNSDVAVDGVSRLTGRLAGIYPRVTEGQPGRPVRRPGPGSPVVVAGGGIAGVSAAVILAEHGIPVVLCEAGPRLGGRLGTDPHTLPDGTRQAVDHGFHGFFRQYYN